MPRTRHIDNIIYIYDALDNRYGFSISVQHWIDCTTFHSFFSWKVWKKRNVFKIFKSWQVCDWLAKWINMLRFMDLRWPRVFRRSNVGLVKYLVMHLIQSVLLENNIISCTSTAFMYSIWTSNAFGGYGQTSIDVLWLKLIFWRVNSYISLKRPTFHLAWC